ncbi:DUF6879 family protein [Streptomyces sp. NPDC059853]|uniref:DUF6879 family protein n=1 Tax=Streptomyces sp. NPDC059853 TaxID=3346973 RepID=UPI00365E96E1
MLDLRLPALDPARGTRLDDDYGHDFRRRAAEIRDGSSWKLERRQHFEEASPSREALRRGDWERALSLLEDRRERLAATQRERQERGYVFHRVRVVEQPLTPYVRWELHALALGAEYGTPVRVIDARTVRDLEHDGLLPEIVVLGDGTLYLIHYTAAGAFDHATRFTDPRLAGPWEQLIRRLFAEGEDVFSYLDREVAPLPPPELTAGPETG